MGRQVKKKKKTSTNRKEEWNNWVGYHCAGQGGNARATYIPCLPTTPTLLAHPPSWRRTGTGVDSGIHAIHISLKRRSRWVGLNFTSREMQASVTRLGSTIILSVDNGIPLLCFSLSSCYLSDDSDDMSFSLPLHRASSGQNGVRASSSLTCPEKLISSIHSQPNQNRIDRLNRLG